MINRRYYEISLIALFFAGICLGASPVQANMSSISAESQECIDCHSSINPGIVADWSSSRHSRITPGEALNKPELERRVSSKDIPDNLRANVVGCFECHSQNESTHKDNFEHFSYQINTIVSPNDCRVCHVEEAEQYGNSKKAEALNILRENPLYHTLVETITSLKTFNKRYIIHGQSSDNAKGESCYACHGTEVKVTGVNTIDTELGEIEVPKLENWPNQGVGRINPDGSYGSCAACHPRHSFSIEIARKPETCSQCHLEPDVPAWNVYRESKHGNIYNSIGYSWNWDNVPWKPGEDFKAPTCAVCHNSLLVDSENGIIANRTHEFGDRLWVRIFGLIYSHPQPKNGKTYLISNADGIPLPTTFDGQPARDFLISPDEQAANNAKMTSVCKTCHGSNWVNSQFAKFEISLAEADSLVQTATQIIQNAWDKKLADPANPFDETIEQMWASQWLFYANSIRYASAMMGPDYAAFKNGWWDATENLAKMHDQFLIEQKLK